MFNALELGIKYMCFAYKCSTRWIQHDTTQKYFKSCIKPSVSLIGREISLHPETYILCASNMSLWIQPIFRFIDIQRDIYYTQEIRRGTDLREKNRTEKQLESS